MRPPGTKTTAVFAFGPGEKEFSLGKLGLLQTRISIPEPIPRVPYPAGLIHSQLSITRHEKRIIVSQAYTVECNFGFSPVARYVNCGEGGTNGSL